MAEQSLIPSKALAQRVAAGDLQEDAGQYTTACQLDQLRAAIIDQQSHGWLRNFIRRTEPMTGLYIYGGVGRGKTMLMDMFFASLPHGNGVPIGWRLHFHAFMVLARDLMHAARAAGLRAADGMSSWRHVCAARKQTAASQRPRGVRPTRGRVHEGFGSWRRTASRTVRSGRCRPRAGGGPASGLTFTTRAANKRRAAREP